MTKTKIILAASLTLATLFGATAAQAATRQVTMGMETFANRCVDQGGVFEATSPVLTCHTETVRIDCAYATSHDAFCSWPGIDNRIAVNRLIGMASIQQSGGGGGGLGGQGGQGGQGGGNGGGGGGNGGGGGINLPDLPIDNGGGGGGIDLPDLPINNK